MCSFLPQSGKSVENELVIAQMNSCVNTLTNIINNKSMSVLEHETDQLLNNLTIQHIVGLPEIAEFRIDLIDAISSLGITEEEKLLLRRINSIKQDNLKWQALSNALNNTMMITGGGNIGVQTGFQTLLTAARTAVEYKTSANELQIEELQAMWELRKDDLKTFTNLRKEALGIIFSLYQKYNLKESDRLTEQSSQQFQKIISEPNPQRMLRLLLDNFSKFSHIADFYYYLGMGYIDCGNLSKAADAFAKYNQFYSKAPIYRLNEKSGLISLAKLAYFQNLSYTDIEDEINNVVANIPSNSMALIQCAAAYDKVLNKPSQALAILRSALDNDATTDKTAIILAASAVLPKVSSQSQEYRAFIAAYENQTYIDFTAELNMLIAQGLDVWDFLKQTINVSGLASRPWYRSKWNFGVGFFCDQSVNVGKKITFSFPNKYIIDLSHVQMWIEKHEKKDVTLTQYQLTDKRNIFLEDIEDVDCFKSNPNLKYLYMESTEREGEFHIKYNIDYAAIEREDYPRQSEFTLSEKDIKNIVKFLKKHEPKSEMTEIVAKRGDAHKRTYEQDSIEWIVKGDSIDISTIRHCELQNGISYVKFILDDVRKIEICYKYENKEEILTPCYIQYQGKKHFANPSYLIEFGYKETPVEKEKLSWWIRTWSSLSGWWYGIWDSVYNWF